MIEMSIRVFMILPWNLLIITFRTFLIFCNTIGILSGDTADKTNTCLTSQLGGKKTLQEQVNSSSEIVNDPKIVNHLAQ